MDGLKISDAARATGFTASALRFYEKAGVVVPERTPAGYRSYGKRDLETLRFVARAKRLGLSLEDVTDLLELLEEDACAPVQERIRLLVTAQIVRAEDRIADLVAFTARLRTAAARLGLHTPDGACDDRCGCRTDPDGAPAAGPGHLAATGSVGWSPRPDGTPSEERQERP